MVSALKVDGRRLHELAREGDRGRARAAAGDRPPLRRRLDAPTRSCTAIEVECSSGTYIRSLAADLGHALGGGAHLRTLRRTAVGSFTESEAHAVDALVLQPRGGRAARLSPRRSVDADVAGAVAHGKVLAADVLGVQGDGPVGRASTRRATLLAVYEPHGQGRHGEARRRARCRPRDVSVRAVEVIRDGDRCPRPPRAAWSRSAPTTASTSVTRR